MEMQISKLSLVVLGDSHSGEKEGPSGNHWPMSSILPVLLALGHVVTEIWETLGQDMITICNFANAFAQKDCLNLKVEFESTMELLIKLQP